MMKYLYVRLAGAFFAGVLAFCSTPRAALAADADSDLRQLRRELLEQRAYIEQLEKRLEAKLAAREKAEMEAKAKSLNVEAGYDNGFYIRSADKPFSLVANGFAQFRYTYDKSAGLSTTQTFDVGLARLALSGVMFDPKLQYFMQIQGSTFGDSNDVTMLDWWMKYGMAPEFGVQAGRFVLPYSRQFFTHPGNLLFSDLSEADFAFNLPRGIGAHVSGKAGRVSYHGAVLNSVRALDAPGQHNIGSNMGGLARVELDILEPYGYYESAPDGPTAPQLSVGLAAAYNPIGGESKFQNLKPKDSTTNVTLDLGFRWDRLALQAAGYYRRDDFTTPGLSDGNDWGYYSQLGYYVIPGRLELAGRVSGVEFDKLNVAGVFRKTTAYTAGLNYYFYGHNVKIQTDYSYLSNDSFKGEPKARDGHRVRLQTQFLF